MALDIALVGCGSGLKCSEPFCFSFEENQINSDMTIKDLLSRRERGEALELLGEKWYIGEEGISEALLKFEQELAVQIQDEQSGEIPEALHKQKPDKGMFSGQFATQLKGLGLVPKNQAESIIYTNALFGTVASLTFNLIENEKGEKLKSMKMSADERETLHLMLCKAEVFGWAMARLFQGAPTEPETQTEKN